MHTPLAIIFNIVTGFAMLLIFIRFMVQFASIEESNPYAEPAYKSSRIVDVFANIFPNLLKGRVSTSALVLLFLIRLIDISGNLALAELSFTPVQLLYVGLISLISDFLGCCQFIIFISIIASFIILLSEKAHPLVNLLMQVGEPILTPFRKLMPNMGMLDLSPMLAWFALMLAEIVLSIIASKMIPMLMSSHQLINYTLVTILDFA